MPFPANMHKFGDQWLCLDQIVFVTASGDTGADVVVGFVGGGQVELLGADAQALVKLLPKKEG